MYTLYQQVIFRPLYNGLISLMDVFPWMDVGIAVIIFTVIIKLILAPLSKASLMTQVKMKEVEPEVNKIKVQFSKDRQVQALKIMELYRERGVRPFAGILLILIQLPILLALISVFYKIIPAVQPDFLYSFVAVPEIKTQFLGFIDLTQKSLVLSLLTGLIQWGQLHFSLASRHHTPPAGSKHDDFAANLAVSMNKQMKFMVPLIAFASTYWLIPFQFPQAAAIIAIYWSVSSLFTLVHELAIRRKLAKKAQ